MLVSRCTHISNAHDSRVTIDECVPFDSEQRMPLRLALSVDPMGRGRGGGGGVCGGEGGLLGLLSSWQAPLHIYAH